MFQIRKVRTPFQNFKNIYVNDEKKLVFICKHFLKIE